MKNTILILTGLLALGACSKEETSPLAPLTFDETTLTINEAKVVDFGPQEGHYNYDFYLVNGSLNEHNAPAEAATFYVYAELFSPGSEAFTAGTFLYSETARLGQPYFQTVVVALDSDKDGQITDADQIIPATGGQLTIEGSNLNYTLTFDLNLLNGHQLKGSYKGAFTYQDKR